MYLAGFGNQHMSEALEGALPKSQNSPQKCALGLYAEQLSGSAFTRPRHLNLRSWLYRRLPSVVHHDYEPYTHHLTDPLLHPLPPNPYRWSSREEPLSKQDFIDGLSHFAGNQWVDAYLYQCHRLFKCRPGIKKMSWSSKTI